MAGGPQAVPGLLLPAPSYLQHQLGLWARKGLPLQPTLPAVGPAVGAWCGRGWPPAADLAGFRGWGPGLASQGLFFFFLAAKPLGLL